MLIPVDVVLDMIEEIIKEAKRQGYTAEEALSRLHARILMWAQRAERVNRRGVADVRSRIN